ncbi:MAG: hypothetical protein ACK40X_03000 [Armatimonadota bacterium]
MVATVKKEKHRTKQGEVSAPPLSRPKSEPKRRPATQWLGNWTYRFLLSGCLFLAWCLVNGLIMMETKAYNQQKSLIPAKEAQIRQLKAKIARRLSELVKDSPKLSTPPTLLSVDSPKPKPTLLGRR